MLNRWIYFRTFRTRGNVDSWCNVRTDKCMPTKTRNHLVLVILTWNLMTGDIRRDGKRGILSRHDREDESLLAETLLNSRSASMSTIARSRLLIRSTIFMLVPVRSGDILAALIRHKISQSCRARAMYRHRLYWNIRLMYDNRPFMVSSVNTFPICAFNILSSGK